MRKERLENLIFTGYTEVERSSGKDQVMYITSLCEWMAKQGVRRIVKRFTLLRATKKDRKLWTAVIDQEDLLIPNWQFKKRNSELTLKIFFYTFAHP